MLETEKILKMFFNQNVDTLGFFLEIKKQKQMCLNLLTNGCPSAHILYYFLLNIDIITNSIYTILSMWYGIGTHLFLLLVCFCLVDIFSLTHPNSPIWVW